MKSGEIFSIDDVTEGVLPDFGFNEVSLEYVHAENIGYKFYLKAEDWSWYTEDINARECGETIDGCGGFPDQEILSKMNKNIEDALNKIVLHYSVETSIELYPEVIVKASFG